MQSFTFASRYSSLRALHPETRDDVSEAWREVAGEATSPDGTSARVARAQYFDDFVLRYKADVVLLLAVGRRVGLTDASRYIGLELYFTTALQQPAEVSGPRSRVLCVAACLVLGATSSATTDSTACLRDILQIPHFDHHTLREHDVRSQMPIIARACSAEMLTRPPAWWRLVEAILDTRIARDLASAVYLLTDGHGQQSSIPRNEASVTGRRSFSKVPSTIATARRQIEACGRHLGYIFDHAIVAWGTDSHVLGGSPLCSAQFTTCDAHARAMPPADTQRTPLVCAPSARVASTTPPAALFTNPATVVAIIVVSSIGLVPGDVAGFMPRDRATDCVTAVAKQMPVAQDLVRSLSNNTTMLSRVS
jgi:hypothetical protein